MDRKHFKQRVVGILVLVALGAIVIPFLLDMHPGKEWWGTGNIPKKPDNGFVTRVLPLNNWAKQAQSELAQGKKQIDSISPHTPAKSDAKQPQPSTPQEKAQTSATTPSPVQAAGTGNAATVVDASPIAKSENMEGWVVQLGSFSSQKNADELSGKLRKQAYQVFVDEITQDGKTIYRVRIGPQRQRADAEKIRDKLVHELQLKPIVLHVP